MPVGCPGEVRAPRVGPGARPSHPRGDPSAPNPHAAPLSGLGAGALWAGPPPEEPPLICLQGLATIMPLGERGALCKLKEEPREVPLPWDAPLPEPEDKEVELKKEEVEEVEEEEEEEEVEEEEEEDKSRRNSRRMEGDDE